MDNVQINKIQKEIGAGYTYAWRDRHNGRTECFKSVKQVLVHPDMMQRIWNIGYGNTLVKRKKIIITFPEKNGDNYSNYNLCGCRTISKCE
jgi:hypothetical protein